MTAFVLVHGAWHGAWCWARVLPLLRAAGHAAHAVTLTGTGERAHLLQRGITLQTHITDVANLVTCEELDDVVLVGHSYGGLVITGAADRLLASQAASLRHLVYIDALVPHPGESWSTHQAPELVASRLAAAAAHPHDALPPPDAALYGLAGADCDWVNRRQTPHPFGPYREPLVFDAARLERVPRTFIDCTDPAWPSIAPMRARVRSEPGWRVRELATGHDAMVSAPVPLSGLLLEAAA
ncbi:MAG TPA: alpha/beta fold hydrolase [Burkholderiaceae bacterium]|nr:alpha/beta fold hydrolase [Burkholderiaceae bacterium]